MTTSGPTVCGEVQGASYQDPTQGECQASDPSTQKDTAPLHQTTGGSSEGTTGGRRYRGSFGGGGGRDMDIQLGHNR